MYTDEDLDKAVSRGVFTPESISIFREQWSEDKQTVSADEENFRLISGFNDIFVVIACLLLLFSSWWVFRSLGESVALGIFVVLSWGLAEFFVRKRKLALPAIVLLSSFVIGVFGWTLSLVGSLDSWDEAKGSVILAAAMAMIAAYLHWLRFTVPITVAAGAAVGVAFIVALIESIFPGVKEWWWVCIFFAGIVIFLLAMRWDASDIERLTRRSDVAFWLHLLSAPLIIHPVFSQLGILDGGGDIASMLIVIALYLLMMMISVIVDRRAFMVSSLIYVIYAISNLLEAYGVVGYSFAITGAVIGGMLLLLSAWWHSVRSWLIRLLPRAISVYVPAVHSSS